MMKIPKVLSFDSLKVSLLKKNGQYIIVKKSSIEEYTQMDKAQKHLYMNPVVVGGLTLRIVPIIGWDSKSRLLTTKFCEGYNMEEYIKNCSSVDKIKLLSVLKQLLIVTKTTGFLWGDFAPRNIIIDWVNATMWLCDFERKIILKECPVCREEFTRYIRNYFFEEFSSFLLLEEQNVLFDGLFTEEIGVIKIQSIASKRKKEILCRLFEIKDVYCFRELHDAEDLMVFIATPYKIDDGIFYPMEIVDRYSSQYGPCAYADLVLSLSILNRRQRYEKLKQIS